MSWRPVRFQSMRVTVNRDSCCGTGQCVMTAPAVFDQSADDGTVLLLSPHPPDSEHPAVRVAAQSCPVSAIEVIED
jgi:ferredoxin